MLSVHTGNKLFSNENGSRAVFGSGAGGWHVINIYDCDEDTLGIKGTNPGGVDFMKRGFPAHFLYNATMKPKGAE